MNYDSESNCAKVQMMRMLECARCDNTLSSKQLHICLPAYLLEIEIRAHFKQSYQFSSSIRMDFFNLLILLQS